MTVAIGSNILFHGDCRDVLRQIPADSIDAVVCDPPYGLSAQPDMAEVLRHWLAGDDYHATGGGFMGKSWDSFVPGPAIWREVFRVLKPGGHLVAFFGTRTYDLGTLAIRLAGFEVRDQLAWVYGSGFPKSLDVSKAIDAALGAERTVISEGRPVARMIPGADQNASGSWIKDNGRVYVPTVTAAGSPEAARWFGWGTALKPAWEPIALARKPLVGTVAQNVLAHGVGGLNIDGCRVHASDALAGRTRHGGGVQENHSSFYMPDSRNESPAGRFPANLMHDGSPEVVENFPRDAGAASPVRGTEPSAAYGGKIFHARERVPGAFHGDSGSAARFFYCAKASRSDRGTGNNHPTVKPTALMQWLTRLVTPPGGLVLDPFMGSGSTGKACVREGFGFIGIEQSAEYLTIAAQRILGEIK